MMATIGISFDPFIHREIFGNYRNFDKWKEARNKRLRELQEKLWVLGVFLGR